MKPIKKGKPIIYDAALKIAVVREYFSSNLGYGRLAAKYNLPSAATVRFFVRWYKTHYPDTVPDQLPVSNEQNTVEGWDAQAELQQAQLKIAALETMIEIARKELGIDIAKKSGTKQSSK